MLGVKVRSERTKRQVDAVLTVVTYQNLVGLIEIKKIYCLRLFCR
jgi:hypothetical protein